MGKDDKTFGEWAVSTLAKVSFPIISGAILAGILAGFGLESRITRSESQLGRAILDVTYLQGRVDHLQNEFIICRGRVSHLEGMLEKGK